MVEAQRVQTWKVGIATALVLCLGGAMPVQADDQEPEVEVWVMTREEFDGTPVSVGASVSTMAAATAVWTNCFRTTQGGQPGFRFFYETTVDVRGSLPIVSYSWSYWMQWGASKSATEQGPVAEDDADAGSPFYPGDDVTVVIQSSASIHDTASGLDHAEARAKDTMRCQVVN